MQTRGHSGFTLVELLVVIAIIGFLAVLVVVRISRAQNQSRNASARSQISQMSKAIEVFKNDVNNSGGQVISAYSNAVVAPPTNVVNTLNGLQCPANPTFNAANALCSLFTGTLNVASNYSYGTAVYRTPSGTSTGTATYTYTYVTKGAADGSGGVKSLAPTGDYLVDTNLVNDSSGDQHFWILNGTSSGGANYPTIP